MKKKSGPQILTADEKALLLEISTDYNDYSRFSFFNKPDSELIVNWPDIAPLINALVGYDMFLAKRLYLEYFNSVADQLYGGRPSRGFNPEEYVMKHWSESTLISQIVLELTERRCNLNRIAIILNEFDCSSSALIRLKNPAITRVYLPLRQSIQIFQDTHTIFRLLAKNVDTENLELFLSRIQGCSVSSAPMYIEPINNIRELHSHDAGRAFIKTLLKFEIFNEFHFFNLEWVLQHAKRENLETFFEYGYRAVVKTKYQRDIMACLFANPDPEVLGWLKNFKIDLEMRGSDGRTPLHFAAEYNMIESVRYLISIGADPNALDGLKGTPLNRAFRHKTKNGWLSWDQECIKLLLIAGSNLLYNYRNNREISWEIFFGLKTQNLRANSSAINLLVAQLAVCEKLGLSVERPLEDYKILQRDRYDDNFYYNKCKEQLEYLKIHKFRNTREFCEQKFTMFALLSQSPEFIFRYIDDDDRNEISTFMEKYKKEKYLITFYYETLENHLEVINRISALVGATKCILAECMGIADVNHLVINKIINYLPARDFLMQNNSKITL